MDDRMIMERFDRTDNKLDALRDTLLESHQNMAQDIAAIKANQMNHDRQIIGMQARCDARGSQCTNMDHRMTALESKGDGISIAWKAICSLAAALAAWISIRGYFEGK